MLEHVWLGLPSLAASEDFVTDDISYQVLASVKVKYGNVWLVVLHIICL